MTFEELETICLASNVDMGVAEGLRGKIEEDGRHGALPSLAAKP
jgi:hypothetical protein